MNKCMLAKDNKVPHLNEYDTQILLLSKGHFDDLLEDVGTTRIEGLKAIWAWRCGIPIKYVELGTIFGHLLEVLESINLLKSKTILEIIQHGCFDNMLWKIGVKDEGMPIIDKLIISTLSQFSIIQVKESIMVDDEMVYADLLTYEDKTTEFLKLLEETE